MGFFEFVFTVEFFFSIIRITAPIIFATLAAIICQKGGVSNIGLEGTMMMSALFGSLFAYYSGSWIVGVLVAIITGIIVSLGIAFFAFNLRTNIILAGTAVNMIGSGGTIFLVKVITGMTEGNQLTSTNGLISTRLQIPVINIPILKDIPLIGGVLSGHSLLTYLAFVLVFLTWALLYKTPIGLNIRSVGENPNAASSVGVSVIKIKYTVLIIGGILAGLGGAFMSMYYSMGWSQDMVAGRGFIALAATAMGGGEPLGGLLAALIFGFAQALSIKASAVGIDSNLVSPIPYLVTIIGLVVFAIVAREKAKKPHKVKESA
ncbi:MAG TPA: ABC transporter permease [Erysipelotrichaceae bacterium]|jgi:simple sugar transport system permease protein|nr:ABC transporter permease [Bacillota bacterium]NLP22153.1 ABC transporter permease [Erysipelotrichaceae bacterium]HCY06698.1 ABC transporter permease [Erysipelotrichaceae bacterium]